MTHHNDERYRTLLSELPTEQAEVLFRHLKAVDEQILETKLALNTRINLATTASANSLIQEKAEELAQLCADRGQVIYRAQELGTTDIDFNNHGVLAHLPGPVVQWIVMRAQQIIFERYDVGHLYEPLENDLRALTTNDAGDLDASE